MHIMNKVHTHTHTEERGGGREVSSLYRNYIWILLVRKVFEHAVYIQFACQEQGRSELGQKVKES